MGPPRYYNLINRQAGRTLYLPPPKSSPAFLLVVMVLAFLAGHEALAKVLTGTGSNDRLIGNESEDRLTGRDGEDRLKGSRGDDRIWGSRGDDKLRTS